MNISELIFEINQYSDIMKWATSKSQPWQLWTWTFILLQSENQHSMKNLKILYFLFLLHDSLCQNYAQTKNLLDNGNLVLHYGVEEQKFKFKLEGRAEDEMGLAFSYDVNLIRTC